MLEDFLQYQRDGFIYRQMQSKEGLEYLENCKRMETTDADYSKLKQFKTK